MPITQFAKRPQSKYTSQFVEEKYPFEAARQAGQMMQQQVDEIQSATSNLGNKLKIDAFFPGQQKIARQREQQYQEKLNQITENFRSQGDIGKTARQVQSLAQQWQNDPIRKKIELASERGRKIRDQFNKMRRKEGISLPPQAAPIFSSRGQVRRGITEQGEIYVPPTSMAGFTQQSDIRKDLESKIDDVAKEKVEIDGVTKNVRPVDRMRQQLGISKKNGQLAISNEKQYRDFINKYRSSLVPLAQQRIAQRGEGDPESSEEINREISDMYKGMAANLINEYRERDITSDSGGGEGQEGFRNQATFGRQKININIGKEDPSTQIKEKAGQKLKEEGILKTTDYNTVLDRLNTIREKLSAGKDVDDEYLNKTEELMGDAEMFPSTIVGDIWEGKFEVEDVDKAINTIQEKVRAEGVEPQIKQLETEVEVVNPPRDIQRDLSQYNFGRVPILEGESGESFESNISDSGLKFEKIVSLPLKYEDGKFKKTDAENNLFLRASGNINFNDVPESKRERIKNKKGGDELKQGEHMPSIKQMYLYNTFVPVTGNVAKQIQAASDDEEFKSYLKEHTDKQVSGKKNEILK